MTERKSPQTKLKESRHYFFLNPYDDMAFTVCPKCGGKTKIRKFCLLIHIEPRHLLSLNKYCRYCPGCDLIIVKKADLERLLAAFFEQNAPDIIGNEYFVYGTMDREEWKNVKAGKMSAKEVTKGTYPFKDIWEFEVIPGGWYPEKQDQR